MRPLLITACLLTICVPTVLALVAKAGVLG